MPSTLAVLKRQLSYRDCYKFNVDVKEGWVNHVPNGIGVMLLNDKSYSSQSSPVRCESNIQISIVSYNKYALNPFKKSFSGLEIIKEYLSNAIIEFKRIRKDWCDLVVGRFA